MVYVCKSAECFSQTVNAPQNAFCIVFGILMTSSGIYICTLKQHGMSTCRQNKHTQRHLVEAENTISTVRIIRNILVPFVSVKSNMGFYAI